LQYIPRQWEGVPPDLGGIGRRKFGIGKDAEAADLLLLTVGVFLDGDNPLNDAFGGVYAVTSTTTFRPALAESGPGATATVIVAGCSMVAISSLASAVALRYASVTARIPAAPIACERRPTVLSKFVKSPALIRWDQAETNAISTLLGFAVPSAFAFGRSGTGCTCSRIRLLGSATLPKTR